MSHPMYNPHGGPFPGGQRTVVTGQYVLGSQSGLDMAGARLGPNSLPSSRGGMMVNQPMTLGRPMGQHQANVPLDLDATIAMNIRGAREEVRLRTQMMQQGKPVDPIYKKDRDAAFPPPGSGLAANSVPGRSANVDWGNFKPPNKLFASSGDGHSFSSSQHFKTSGFGGGGEQSSLDSQPSSEYQTERYTPESANSILAKFGLSSDDLELLSLYPDDQLTPDNLPYILRDIRMRKSKRNDDRQPSESQQGKVIDYGHSSKFGFSEEKADSHELACRPKESSKFGMDIATSSVSIDKTRRPLQPPSAAVHTQSPVMVPKLHPSVMASRPSSQNLSNQSVKSIMERLPPMTPLQHMSRSPLVSPAFASSLAPVIPTSSGSQFAFSSHLIGTSTATVTKRLPTPTMMNDYSAATPRIFPHTCSLCNIECAKLKDWIEHQNTSRHIESCRRLRKQYPDWKADTIPVTRNEEQHSPKRRTRSHSYSRSPSPKRHHGSSSHRHRSRSRSRSRSHSPRRSRRTRSRSLSWSPPWRSRASPTYRRRSRTPPRQRSRSPDYSSSRRVRRASPRRNSPLRSQRSSSSELLAKKLLNSSELSSVSDSNSLKAMVQSLAPALLAELAKKRNSSVSSSGKGGSSRKRSTSPPSKRSDSSKASSSSATKTTKDVRPKNPGAPGASCLLRFKKVPLGTTHEELVKAVLPFGKIYTAILLRKMEEASVCMMREEDAKALINCKDLKLRGQIVSISLEKDATQSLKHSEHQSKPEAKRKEPKPAAEKQSNKMSQGSKPKESSKTSQPAKAKVIAKTPQTAKEKQMVKTKVLKPTPGETQVKRVVRKEIPWRKNIVEITDLPEDVAEDELAKLGAPHGCISKPVIAVTQHKAYLQMPSAEAAEALVKAYSESPVKIQNKEINITLMTRPIDLKYTESIFRALMGMDKLSPNEKASLPERLLSVSNIPTGSKAITDVQNLVKRFGSFKQCLPLNGRIIFEMDSPALARAVCSRFIKFPCIIQNNTLSFKLIKVSKATEQIKKKLDSSGPKPNLKAGCKAPETAKSSETQSAPAKLTAAPTLTSGAVAVAAKVDSESDLNKGIETDVKKSPNELKVDASSTVETSSNEKAAAVIAPDADSKTTILLSETASLQTDASQSDIQPFEDNASTLNISATDTTTSVKNDHENDLVSKTEQNTVVDAEQPILEDHGLPKVSTDKEDGTENAKEELMDTSEEASVKGADQEERSPVEAEGPAEGLPVKVEVSAMELPVKVEVSVMELPVKVEEPDMELPVKMEEPAEGLPVKVEALAENIPVKAEEPTEELVIKVEEPAEELPIEAKTSPVEVEEPAKSSPVETTEHFEIKLLGHGKSSPIETEMSNKDCMERDGKLKTEIMPDEPSELDENLSLDKHDEAQLQHINETKPMVPSDSKDVSSKPQEEEPKNESMDTSAPGTEEAKQNELKPQGTEQPGEVLVQDESDICKTVQNDGTLQASSEHQVNEKVEVLTQSLPSGDMQTDIPPVTAEILKALEAAVHQCRLQSSLRRAEETRAQSVTVAKDTEKATSSSKKSSTSDMDKKRESHSGSRRSEDKVKNTKTSGSRSKPDSIEKESSSRHRSMASPDNDNSTRRGSSTSSTGSRRSMADSSPVSRRKECDEGGIKSRSTGRQTRSLRSDSKAKPKEKVEEDVDELFPFNLDEFVTVDEVVDETVEATSPKNAKSLSRARGAKDNHTGSTTKKKGGRDSGSMKKSSTPTTRRQTRSSLKAQETPVKEKHVAAKPITDVKEPKNLKKSQVPEDDPISTECQSEAVSTEMTDSEEITNNNSSTFNPTTNLDASDLSKQPLEPSEGLKSKIPLDDQDHEPHSDPLHSESLMTLDEVAEYEDDEDIEDEQLVEALKDLVTLDEIVAEEDECDTLVSMDEMLGNEEMNKEEKEMNEGEKEESSHCSQENESATQPAGPASPEDSEELGRSFVTVDEVGEEEEEKQEMEEVPTTKRGRKPKRRARQKAVRVSNRQKGISSSQLEEDSELGPTDKDHEVNTQVSEVQKTSDSPNMEIHSSATEDEKSSSSTQEPEVTPQETNTDDEKSPAKKRAAVKGKSKLRRKAQSDQEPESKRPCTEPLVPEDFTLPPFNPDNPIGIDFVVPKTGFFCKLCSLFYGSEVTAKKTHCSSLRHYENMQKYYEKLKSEPSALSLSAHSSTTD